MSNINDAGDDVFQVGRSPMWDGDPLWDRRHIYLTNTAEAIPAAIEAEPLLVSPRTEGRVICPNDGEEYDVTEGHVCRSSYISGTVRKLKNGDHALIFSTEGDNVIYFKVPQYSTQLVSIPLSQFKEEVE